MEQGNVFGALFLHLTYFIWPHFKTKFQPVSMKCITVLYFESNQVKGENLCIFKTNYCLFSNETAHSYFVEIFYEFFNSICIKYSIPIQKQGLKFIKFYSSQSYLPLSNSLIRRWNPSNLVFFMFNIYCLAVLSSLSPSFNHIFTKYSKLSLAISIQLCSTCHLRIEKPSTNLDERQCAFFMQKERPWNTPTISTDGWNFQASNLHPYLK